MTTILPTLLLDILLSGLLIVTISYCWKLNKRIRVLQDSKSDIAQLIQQFDELTERATLSIADIHQASKRIHENMQHKLDKANFLANDLSFMIEKGSKLAERMDGGAPISGARKLRQGGGGAAAVEKEIAARSSRRDSATMPGREDKAARGARRSKDDTLADKESDAAIEGVLDKLAGRKSGRSDTAKAKPQRQGVRLRSKAEQELYDALQDAGNG